MNFRKRVNLMKGVKMNVSKSGASVTVGGKGLSLNIGKNGVYLNTSLPGTGLYDRHKLFDMKSLSKRATTKKQAQELDYRNYQMEMNESGKIEIYRLEDGRAASAEEVRLLKRTEWYDQQAEELQQQFVEQLNEETVLFTTLHKNAQKVEPAAEPEAAEVVEAQLDAWLGELEMPVDFDIDYEYNPDNGSIMVNLDVPEIEDLPEEKATQLASGEIKAKNKTQKELREEYRTCVCGLAVFFASHIFLVCPGIRTALISGYTQRRDKNTGEKEDHYILTVAFEREAFETTACKRDDPYDFIEQFRSRINVTSTGEMKEIVPYTAEEFAEICAELDD